MPCDNCDNKMFSKDDPLITIVRNPENEKFTVTLQNWDTPEIVDGYSKQDVEELINMLKDSIYHLENCWDDHNHESLFNEEAEKNAEKETITR